MIFNPFVMHYNVYTSLFLTLVVIHYSELIIFNNSFNLC